MCVFVMCTCVSMEDNVGRWEETDDAWRHTCHVILCAGRVMVTIPSCSFAWKKVTMLKLAGGIVWKLKLGLFQLVVVFAAATT